MFFSVLCLFFLHILMKLKYQKQNSFTNAHTIYVLLFNFVYNMQHNHFCHVFGNSTFKNIKNIKIKTGRKNLMRIWNFCILVLLSCQVARPNGVRTNDCLRLHLLRPEILIKFKKYLFQHCL